MALLMCYKRQVRTEFVVCRANKTGQRHVTVVISSDGLHAALPCIKLGRCGNIPAYYLI